MSFINDSGVIIDDSLSPARRWLKENLLIEQYAQVIRFTGVADDTRQRIEYEYIDETTAIAEYNVLYGYLEDYGGGGGGTPLEIEQDGVSVEADTHKINVLAPLEATSSAPNETNLAAPYIVSSTPPTYNSDGRVYIKIYTYNDSASSTREERFSYNADGQIDINEFKDDLKGIWVQITYTWTGNQNTGITYTPIIAWSI
jgi:hypothetical protein